MLNSTKNLKALIIDTHSFDIGKSMVSFKQLKDLG